MSTQMQGIANSHRVRIALNLIVASCLLQCILVFGIFELHPNVPAAYLLALVSCLPILAMVALAARVRALNPDAIPHSYLIGITLFAVTFVAGNLVMTMLEVFFFSKSLVATGILASVPIFVGIVPAFLLLMPKRVRAGQGLGEPLLPVRTQLATPTLRHVYRVMAFLLVYMGCDFASRMFLGRDTAPKGVLGYAIALLPVLPIFGLIPIYKKYMADERDEYQRHLFNQSILWAFLGTLIVVCGAERLEDDALILHNHVNFFRSPVWVFYFLQLEAGFVVKAIQAARLTRNQ